MLDSSDKDLYQRKNELRNIKIELSRQYINNKDIVVLLPDDQFLRKCLGLALDALDFTLLKSLKAS